MNEKQTSDEIEDSIHTMMLLTTYPEHLCRKVYMRWYEYGVSGWGSKDILNFVIPILKSLNVGTKKQVEENVQMWLIDIE